MSDEQHTDLVITSYSIHYTKLYESHTPALIEEEKQFIKKLSEQQLQQCLEIKNTLELDYFGIDCHIAPDGRMLLFSYNFV